MTSLTPEKILVPVDFSDYSREALKTAVGIAGGRDGALTILHVMEEPTPPPGYGQASVIYAHWAQMKEDIERTSVHVLEAMISEAGGSRDGARRLEGQSGLCRDRIGGRYNRDT